MQTPVAAQSDLDTLLALNRDYIRSVQTSDARRFDELLADDFLCSNPDGSLVDREGFLKQTVIDADSPAFEFLIGVGRGFLGLQLFLRLREQLLSSLPWRGDERVLDVGCGHGLMLIGAAKRLPRGKSVGVDLWQNEDQAANSHQATERNANLEGVLSRVEIRDADARHLPFDEAAFDVVSSSWALHNIYAQEERRQALKEMIRVVRPGGTILIIDIRHAAEYASTFAELGLQQVRLSRPHFTFVIPSRSVRACKPEIVP